MAETQNQNGRALTPWLMLSLALILLFAFAPIISVLLASAIASSAGCDLNEAVATSCIVMGWEMGPSLTSMFVAGWYMLLTLPVGLVAFGAWVLVLVWRLSRRRAPNANG